MSIGTGDSAANGGSIAEIWRYPIKAHGRESVKKIRLTQGQTLPWDRHWAVAHARSKANGAEWVPCGHFTRGAKIPALMAIEADLDEATGRLRVSHPHKAALRFCPATEPDRFIEWVKSLSPPESLQPERLVIANPTRGMTDTDYPSISITNKASNADLFQKMGKGAAADLRRWRSNIVLDGLKPWEEMALIGRKIHIGKATLLVREPIKRCMATAANPDTGARDIDMLVQLERHFGHQNFGIYAEVMGSGDIAVGDRVAFALD